jgi:hypothetical protein
MVKPSTNNLKVKLDLAQRLRSKLVRMLITDVPPFDHEFLR